LLFFTISNLLAQENPTFPKGELSPTNVHHVGDIWLNELTKADDIFNYNVTQATFSANARLDWHKHHSGQILLVTEGIGYYQERNKPLQIIQKGSVIKCNPDVELWHGATPTTGLVYIATTPIQKGKTVWLEPLSEKEYSKNKTEITMKNNEQEILDLSKTKWDCMATRNTDSLNTLFSDKAVFVHMGGTMTKEKEINIIKEGHIKYKKAEIQESSVEFIENTAVLLNNIRLKAIVGGNEVINPFVVTEVYVHQNETWSLLSMSFTKINETLAIVSRKLLFNSIDFYF
jgi:4-carboxymuconolactone decarboxylase